MEMDLELVKDFQVEIIDISKEVEIRLVAALKNPKGYEGCGQAIDRIYGTAATLGFDEIADYSLAMKEVCYKGSLSTGIGLAELERLVRKFMEMVGGICTSMVAEDTAQISKAQLQMKAYAQSARDLSEGTFRRIKKTSC